MNMPPLFLLYKDIPFPYPLTIQWTDQKYATKIEKVSKLPGMDTTLVK